MKKYLMKLINEALSSRTITATVQIMPIGYNPVESMRGALLHWVAVPFNKQEVWCQLRCPNAVQLEQCGDITNIVLDKHQNLKEGELPKYERDEVIKIRNYQEELCKAVFNIPTYDEITRLVDLEDFVISDKKKEITRLQELIEANKGKMSEAEKSDLDKKIRKVEFQIGYILPDDTMDFVTQWAMGNDVSDIKKITKEKFLRAAFLAKLHGKSPSDYLSGVFTDFNRNEIDAYAAMVLDEHMKEHEAVEKEKNQWFGRKGKKAG